MNLVRTQADQKREKQPPNREKKKKATITLSLDELVLEDIKYIAQEEGLSINSKINKVLTEWLRFFRFHKEHGALVMTKEDFQAIIDHVEEDFLIKRLRRNAMEVIPPLYAEKNIPRTLDNMIEYEFRPFGEVGGVFQDFSRYKDEEGYTCLSFRHHYGIKWSKVLSEALGPHICNTLNCHVVTSAITANMVVLKIMEKGMT